MEDVAEPTSETLLHFELAILDRTCLHCRGW